MPWEVIILGGIWGGVLALVYLMMMNAQTRYRSERRLYELAEGGEETSFDNEPRYLRRWLYLAGFRHRTASFVFFLVCAICVSTALLVSFGLFRTGILGRMELGMSALPGGLGELLIPIIWLTPWVLITMFVLMPVVVVRAARRHRVQMVEQDMPLTMEMMATLTEAGLGFDAALERILNALRRDRPISQEFRLFRVETLSGRPRVECFRRLSRRLDVPTFSVFIAAVVQAEQVGAGIAEVLRRQSDDMRNRRRERALEFVMSRPVKLLVPMVICFLPGILIWTLGPAFHDLLRLLDTLSSGMRGL